MVARGGIEPPTRGFSAARDRSEQFINQQLAALANPYPSLTTALLRQSQFGFVAVSSRCVRAVVVTVTMCANYASGCRAISLTDSTCRTGKSRRTRPAATTRACGSQTNPQKLAASFIEPVLQLMRRCLR